MDFQIAIDIKILVNDRIIEVLQKHDVMGN